MPIRLGLSPRIFWVFVSFAALLLAGVGLLSFVSGRDALRQAVDFELQSLVVDKQSRIEAWIVAEVDDLEVLAGSPALRKSAQQLSGATGALNRSAKAQIVGELLPHVRGSGKRSLLALAVAEPINGDILVSVGATLQGQSLDDREYWQEGRSGTTVSDPYHSQLLQQPALAVATPLRDSTGEVVAVVVAWFDLAAIEAIVQQRSGLRRTDDAYLIDDQARLLTRPRLLPEAELLQPAERTPAVAQCLAGSEAALVAEDYRGVPALIALRHLSKYRMCVLAKLDIDEALAPAWAFGISVLWISALVLLLAALLAWRLALTISRPVRALQDGMARFWQGERALRQPVIGDDVLARMAEEFNRMADAIVASEARLRDDADELERQVTERTAELVDSESRTRAILAGAHDAFVAMDADGRVIDWNPQATALFGWTLEQVLGQPLERLLIPERLREAHVRGLQNYLQTGEGPVLNRPLELPALHRDGHELPIELTIASVALADGVMFCAFLRDISERRRAQEELNRFFELSLDLLCIASSDGYFKRLNPSWETVLGYPREQLLNQPFMEFVHPEDHPATLRETENLSQGQRTIAFENRYRCVDGSYRWLAWQAAPSPDGSSIYAAARDITERKSGEAQLREAKDVAVRASHAKSEFLANMSHEIRTPLNGVLGTLGLLMKTSLGATQRELAGLARASGETLLLVINDILDFAKIEAGKLDLETVPLDLRELAEEVTSIVALQAVEKDLDVVLRYPAEVPRFLIGDPGRIRQILINLANNAIKFTERGHVLIEVKLDPALAAQADHPAPLRVQVEDTGIGIADAQCAQLFRKFTQADASTTRRFGGTGLGLAISKQLVELMGGKIGVDSAQGRGSTFWFTLPLPQQSEQPAVPDVRALSDWPVLAVDDNPVNRRVLQEQLSEWGLRNVACESAMAALKVLRAARDEGRPFRIAILDYQMPEVDGEMLGRAILADPQLRDTALVMLSSLSRGSDETRLRELGFAAYLVKPVRQSDLLNALSAIACTAGPRPRREAKPESRERFNGVRALLAEDNTTNQYVATMMLRHLGCTVAIAGDGREAVRMVDEGDYDIVFMDCEMPELDGFSATAAIRGRDDAKARLPIVAVTAQAMHGDRQRCLDAGMDDYISKPIEAEAMATVLRRWFAARPDAGAVAPAQAVARAAADIAPALDPQTIARLQALAQATDPALLQQVFASFRSDAELRLGNLRAALANGDAATVRATAHMIKGAAANIGAQRLAEHAQQLHALAQSGTVQGAGPIVDALALELARTLQEIEQL